MQNVAINTAVEQRKHVVIYFYDRDDVSVHFKVLSSNPLLQDNFAFYSLYQPSEDLMASYNLKELPTVGGILAAETENDASLKQFMYGGRIDYDDMLSNLIQMSGKQDELYKQEQAKKGSKERKFEEITNIDKFKKNCLDKKKGCAIAFLPGHTQVRLQI